MGSAEFQKLAAEAGKLKDQINDAAEAVRANAGNSFESLSNNASVLKDRLFNLDLEGVGQSFKSIAGTVKGFSFKEIQAGLGSLSSGLGAIGKALLTNPIFLIAGAIAAAVAYSDELLSLVDGISDADQEQLAAQKEKTKLAQENLDSISAQEEILKEQGLTEQQILDLKQKQLDEVIANQKATIETSRIQLQAQVDAAKRNKEILSGIIQFLTAPLQILLGAVDGIIKGLNYVGVISDETFASIGSLREGFNDSVSSLLFDPEQIQKDGEAAIKEQEKTLTSLENQAAGFRNKEREAARKAAKEKRDAAEKEAQFIAELYAEQELQIEANNQALADRLAAIWQKANELSRAAQQQQADDVEAIQLDIEQRLDERGKSARELEMQNLQDKYFEQKTMLENAGKDTTALTELYESEQNAIKEKYAKEDLDRKQRIQDFTISSAQSGLSTIQSFTELFAKKSEASAKRAFQIQKAVSIAQTTIDTYKGAQSIFAAAAANPATILFPAQPFIAAGLAVAAGIANVAKIASQKFEGGGGVSGGGGGGIPSLGGGGGGSQPSVPAFNALNLGFLQNRPDQTPKAYVLAQDVSTAVEARDKVRDLARIN